MMQTVAIIGTGISGMGAAYFLKDRYKLSLYEKENYAGGHTNTLTVKEDGQDIFIDSAFMVYNETTYPLLTRLFKELDVVTKPTSMSFSVQHRPSGLEYCGTGLSGLFAQRWRVFDFPYIAMLLEISRFRKEALKVLDNPLYEGMSLAAYAKAKGFSDAFLQKFLIPMSSAVWSTPADIMLDFPVQSLVRFFDNHRFLSLEGQLAWRTCEGGSRQYRDKIMKKIGHEVFLNRPVVAVWRKSGKVVVRDRFGDEKNYDKVIIACHADDALRILQDPSPEEASLLSKFSYINNKATLHADEGLMPQEKRVWSSWNNRIEKNHQGKMVTSTIYWMNSLQGVSRKRNYFISINDPGVIDLSKILWENYYTHPLYTVEAQKAQAELPRLNRNGHTFFSGAYFRYGFHEDGLMSGLEAAKALAGCEVWP